MRSRAALYSICSFFLLVLNPPRAISFDGGSGQKQDSIIRRSALYFSTGEGVIIERKDDLQLYDLILWVVSNPSSKVDIKGWTDPTGSEQINSKLSDQRAMTAQRFLINEGLSSSRITVEGLSVDRSASSDAAARRADIIAYIPAYNLESEYKPEDVTTVEVVAAPEPEPDQTYKAIYDDTSSWSAAYALSNLSYYIGGGAGVSFGRSSFSSMSVNGTKIGFNGYLFGGADISETISAELSLGYTSLTMGAYDCCQGLYYADGERYFAPVAGLVNYRYEDLESKSGIFSIEAKVNFDILSLLYRGSDLSVLLSPKVGVGFSSSQLYYDALELNSRNGVHFMAGADFGVGYMFDLNWGLRLTSGVAYLTGGGLDVMPQVEHSSNFLWSNSIALIYKF